MTARAASDNERSMAGVFFSQPEEPLRSYRAYRRMHAWSEKPIRKAGWKRGPSFKNGQFQYEIVTERGSDTIRNRVLRAVLKREQELVADGDMCRGNSTPEDYDFSEAGRDSDGTHVVQIMPGEGRDARRRQDGLES